MDDNEEDKKEENLDNSESQNFQMLSKLDTEIEVLKSSYVRAS